MFARRGIREDPFCRSTVILMYLKGCSTLKMNMSSYMSLCFHAEQKIQENETLDRLFADLDQNGDLEIDFKEFIALIAMVTSACEELFVPNNS